MSDFLRSIYTPDSEYVDRVKKGLKNFRAIYHGPRPPKGSVAYRRYVRIWGSYRDV